VQKVLQEGVCKDHRKWNRKWNWTAASLGSLVCTVCTLYIMSLPGHFFAICYTPPVHTPSNSLSSRTEYLHRYFPVSLCFLLKVWHRSWYSGTILHIGFTTVREFEVLTNALQATTHTPRSTATCFHRLLIFSPFIYHDYSLN